MRRERSALLLVDIQPDFMPGGALPVASGEQIVAPVKRLMESDRFSLQIATQDWHPSAHISFASRHPGRQPFDNIQLYGHDQTLWPDHCIQGSEGAQLSPQLPWHQVAAVIRKGMDPMVDSYSGFRNNWDVNGVRPGTGLAGYLREREIDTLYICGLARDVCVKWTAEDGVEAGFQVFLLWDATRSVYPDNDEALRADLDSRQIKIIPTSQLGF